MEAAELLSNDPDLEGVEINVLTLNTPSVEGGTQLFDEANERVNYIHVAATNYIVVPHGGFNKSGGPLNSRGEKTNLIGKPNGGEFSYPNISKGSNQGRASRYFSSADVRVAYKDAYKGRLWTGGPKTWLTGHRGWLPNYQKRWMPLVKGQLSNK